MDALLLPGNPFELLFIFIDGDLALVAVALELLDHGIQSANLHKETQLEVTHANPYMWRIRTSLLARNHAPFAQPALVP